MAYNLYQVQMAKAWAERIDKENAMAEKFWHSQSLKGSTSLPASPSAGRSPHVGAHYFTDSAEVRSQAGSVGPARSAAPTGFTSKTSYLKSRMEQLEVALQEERESRKKVEADLNHLRSSLKR
ncbi:hypothetical protein CHLRE_15g637050v5 [Chlamydomonas reinhardtii]|uniref:Uncharacterized protein n=1 Tax=Chlamydomonas reinhardtii TaxID=3055 RepID=A8JEB9_CHLRE|nr:uncharacterized protein CHLRE_15g637050v5 [Chlamydomonas reinhardtii]PNW72649.1 hypothetical protein CHLRE_15g637050v5 [Chlamydomonas reinhardtii]|eukprot:XP_001701134.1 flagellar associated protein [Chlamydomonas reinhardtii]